MRSAVKSILSSGGTGRGRVYVDQLRVALSWCGSSGVAVPTTVAALIRAEVTIREGACGGYHEAVATAGSYGYYRVITGVEWMWLSADVLGHGTASYYYATLTIIAPVSVPSPSEYIGVLADSLHASGVWYTAPLETITMSKCQAAGRQCVQRRQSRVINAMRRLRCFPLIVVISSHSLRQYRQCTA
jgi:hypothetical protein